MKKQTNWLVVMILILALAGLACNAVLGDDAEPTADSTTIDPAVTVPAETGGETEGETSSDTGGAVAGDAAPTLNLNPENNFGIPSDVNSYRISMDVQFEETKADGTVENGRITGTGAQVVNPFAMTFDFTIEGSNVSAELGGGAFSMTQIGDITYVNLGGTCVSTSGSEIASLPFNEFTSSASVLGSLQGAELVEENVTINGIQTNHYQFDDSDLAQGEQAFGTVQNVDGHVYVASDGGYLVRMTMEADAQNLGLSGTPTETTNGHIVYQVDYSDFNAPIEITAPEGCGAGDSEFPILDDATNVNSFGDILSYDTATAFDAVVEFYKSEMAAAGYSLTSEFAEAPTALLTFSLDGANVTVSVVDSVTSDGHTVVITKG